MRVEYREGQTWRELNGSSGLQRHRAKGSRPASGRWMGAGPIAFNAGDANLYRYAWNDAVNAADPSGLAAPPRHVYYFFGHPEMEFATQRQIKALEDVAAMLKRGVKLSLWRNDIITVADWWENFSPILAVGDKGKPEFLAAVEEIALRQPDAFSDILIARDPGPSRLSRNESALLHKWIAELHAEESNSHKMDKLRSMIYRLALSRKEKATPDLIQAYEKYSDDPYLRKWLRLILEREVMKIPITDNQRKVYDLVRSLPVRVQRFILDRSPGLFGFQSTDRFNAP